ncbi:MAG TPA: hypothetical protein VHZ31_09315 [Solirubrobacteraceae bacterium]|nr:hypothetical protein [Solirubrobacteraceae bacterium]
MTRPRRLSLLLFALLVSATLSACGVHESKGLVRTADTEGTYLDINGLKYQVEVSRQMNVYDTQDKPYMVGIPKAQQHLDPDQIWFGVFMRVQNEGSKPLRPSDDVQISDTQGKVYRPIGLQQVNTYAYRSYDYVPAGQIEPLMDTPGYDTPARGLMILFKLTLTTLNNRPLVMKIEGRGTPQQTGLIDLDV